MGSKKKKKAESTAKAAKHRLKRERGHNLDEIARAVVGYLTELREEVSGVKSVLLSTGDGIHVCSLGMEGPQAAAQLAALNATMYGVAGAQVELLSGLDSMAGETVVSVTMPGEILTVVSVAYAPVGNLLLAVSAEDTQLGMVILRTRQAADELAGWLADV